MPNNGGSSIISYEVQMDDGKNGIFTSIIGFTSHGTSFGGLNGLTFKLRRIQMQMKNSYLIYIMRC